MPFDSVRNTKTEYFNLNYKAKAICLLILTYMEEKKDNKRKTMCTPSLDIYLKLTVLQPNRLYGIWFLFFFFVFFFCFFCFLLLATAQKCFYRLLNWLNIMLLNISNTNRIRKFDVFELYALKKCIYNFVF